MNEFSSENRKIHPLFVFFQIKNARQKVVQNLTCHVFFPSIFKETHIMSALQLNMFNHGVPLKFTVLEIMWKESGETVTVIAVQVFTNLELQQDLKEK